MAKFPNPMVDMQATPEEKMDCDMPMPTTMSMDAPQYPYGLHICLTEKELDKLGLDHTSAEVGGMFHGHFMARITSVSEDQRADGKSCRVEATIENLCIESEDDENEEADEGD